MEQAGKQWTRRKFLTGAGLVVLGSLVPGAALWGGERVHLVRRGDTLSELAQRYGVSVGELKRVNGLRSDLIKVGQRLRIPSGGPSAVDEAAVRRVLRGTRIDRGRWKYIVAHHSAIRYGNAAVYDRNHRRRGMQNGLAYHFVIGNGVDSGDGEIEAGPRWRGQLHGGHVRKWEVNKHGIGICLVGNFEESRPTRRQLESFEALVGYLGGTVLRGQYEFLVHKEVDPRHTVCPGRHFPVAAMHRLFG